MYGIGNRRSFDRWRLPCLVIGIWIFSGTARAQPLESITAEKIPSAVLPYGENDFAQKQPLLDALNLGFRFIEADTFLIGDRLMIGSSVLDMQSKGTLEDLYLAPLEKLVNEGSTLVKRDGVPLYLFIDIKSEPDQTYLAVRRLLMDYMGMLTKVVDGQVQSGSVTAIITGNYPRERIAAENPRWVAIDGRISDVDSNAPTHLIPTISARWGSHFRWSGRAEITESERRRLQEMISKVHAKQRLIRFWSTPDVDRVWSTMRAMQVDLIGSESIVALSEFLIPRKSPFEPLEPPVVP